MIKKQYKSMPTGRCTACGQGAANQWHHLFSRTKWSLKLYGAALLDDERNLQPVCSCHASHAAPGLIHWSEEEFCSALGIQPRSKTASRRFMAAMTICFCAGILMIMLATTGFIR
jgi:hypothetical protein